MPGVSAPTLAFQFCCACSGRAKLKPARATSPKKIRWYLIACLFFISVSYCVLNFDPGRFWRLTPRALLFFCVDKRGDDLCLFQAVQYCEDWNRFTGTLTRSQQKVAACDALARIQRPQRLKGNDQR